MHDKFLNGDDKEHFNYEDVDFNSEYDDKKVKGQDEEDEWFDEEDEEQAESKDAINSEYTGELDYWAKDNVNYEIKSHL